MLSALIPSEHGYSASALGRTTETPEVRLPRSSRTIGSSSSSILTPTSDRDRQYCYSSQFSEGDRHFYYPLHIAIQFGLYLLLLWRVWRIVSEDSKLDKTSTIFIFRYFPLKFIEKASFNILTNPSFSRCFIHFGIFRDYTPDSPKEK